MRSFFALATAFCATLWSGCGTINSSVAPPVTAAMIAVSGGASAQALERGREVYAGPCTSCHAADPVGKYTMVRWREIVGDMAERTELNASDKSALLAYLTAATSMPLRSQ